MTRLRLAALVVLALAGFVGMGGVAAAPSAVAASPASCTGGVIRQPDVSPPPGYTKVIDVVMGVTNDEDSGMWGYWALDNYRKHIQVWQDGSSFYVAVIYDGTWHTFAGALSPGYKVGEPSDGTGSMQGGYIATMTGSMLSSPTETTHGSIGTYDFGGTKSDIMLGTYGNGQTGDPAPTSWLGFYFDSTTSSTFAFADGGNAWGWVYTGNSTTGEWCNTGTGSSGDIVTH
ncbi:MAG: hypothetical protein M0Z69_09335 [Actinomycetota bacterium]|nr:hypothetical protein [Actinomycetota bacterium]